MGCACVSVEAVAVAEVAEVKENILESSLKKKKKVTLLKAFKGLWEGEEVSAVAFL